MSAAQSSVTCARRGMLFAGITTLAPRQFTYTAQLRRLINYHLQFTGNLCDPLGDKNVHYLLPSRQLNDTAGNVLLLIARVRLDFSNKTSDAFV